MNENVGLNILSYFLQSKSNTLKEQGKNKVLRRNLACGLKHKKAFIIAVSVCYSYRGKHYSDLLHSLDVHVTTCSQILQRSLEKSVSICHSGKKKREDI